ncbi:MAG: hypothetical protein H0W01_10530 [Pseudonocardiales bacterium]|nr:hypothetical protein [Pseudonocardiales bacterium]
MQVLIPTTTIGWWLCADCGAEAPLPIPDISGYVQPCPDCAAEMALVCD